MNRAINQIYSLHQPASSEAVIPLVFDSPHSGTVYPLNSGIVAPAAALRSTWDAYVDELWSAAPSVGASILAARFPRAYIDPNRSPLDIDPDLLADAWHEPLFPTERSKRGMGLVRRYALPGVPMYKDALSASEVRQRISQYYDEYHRVLRKLLDTAHQDFGAVWHIDCHSMKSVGNAMNVDNGSPRPDIVVSDRQGTSCDPAFTQWVAGRFKGLGYAVSINSPYLGGHIVTQYGNPSAGRHCLQIEFNRSLYMNESNFEKTAGFEKLKFDLLLFLAELARYVRKNTGISPSPVQGCA
ncbi:N-formylglutamate amidohydrolase [Noviherbaspirillum saxi]|uniref:N-formylglutamate amidohydrolase n=1 Tax=Noviherbaspirillum saxi TaxID=2320863 RepID=A0A3A3FF09_9BURK|nr:N-formylglutamate amidohydrolase [Noviherbaspirillum saxi]RJF91931.1 N-formylglutamate amidohydrolase [Noviherbaspirillum saxi]